MKRRAVVTGAVGLVAANAVGTPAVAAESRSPGAGRVWEGVHFRNSDHVGVLVGTRVADWGRRRPAIMLG
ncbi:hypothetical protein ACPA54_02490 [Uniformispora flossi]|uniref:hypothetical protein n=1 Tax=Uniformispora flossi TaxID=3390723 RepID=UPI003C2F4900